MNDMEQRVDRLETAFIEVKDSIKATEKAVVALARVEVRQEAANQTVAALTEDVKELGKDVKELRESSSEQKAWHRVTSAVGVILLTALVGIVIA